MNLTPLSGWRAGQAHARHEPERRDPDREPTRDRLLAQPIAAARRGSVQGEVTAVQRYWKVV